MADIKIPQLNDFTGILDESYLAIDDGVETYKILGNQVGVQAQLTQAEAEAGTVTEPRVVTPAVINSYVNDTVDTAVTAMAESLKTLVLDIASFSSLPQTVTDANITSDMVVVNSVLGTPSAQTSDWTVTAADGSVTIAGSINGSTTLALYLMKSGTPVAVSTIKKDDTGWISLVPYVESGYAARQTSGSYMPAYRILNGVLYFKGFIYSTSAKGSANGTLASGLPSELAPIDERTFVGKRYNGTYYSIRYENGSIRVQDSENIESQANYSGYSLSPIIYPLK